MSEISNVPAAEPESMAGEINDSESNDESENEPVPNPNGNRLWEVLELVETLTEEGNLDEANYLLICEKLMSLQNDPNYGFIREARNEI